MPLQHAPRWFVDRLKAIDADLGVEWLDHEGKWAIVQRLHNTPNLETMTDRATTAIMPKLLEQGYQLDRTKIAAMMYLICARNHIVFRVENKDGSFRELDQRVLDVLAEMAWKVRHRDVKDWLQAGDLMDYEARRIREKDEEDLWHSLSKDRVFCRVLSDTAAGLRIHHTVHGRPDRQRAA